MPTSIKGSSPSSGRGGSSNVTQTRRFLSATEANIKAYPGNFRFIEVGDVDWTDITSAQFYVSKKTLWAKE